MGPHPPNFWEMHRIHHSLVTWMLYLLFHPNPEVYDLGCAHMASRLRGPIVPATVQHRSYTFLPKQLTERLVFLYTHTYSYYLHYAYKESDRHLSWPVKKNGFQPGGTGNLTSLPANNIVWGRCQQKGAQNINYTVYNITMQTGRVEYICRSYIKYVNCVDTTEPTHPLSPRRWLCLLLSYYFQPYLVTEFSFNTEARGSIRLKSWFVNASFKGTSKIESIFKSPTPWPRLLS